MKSWKIGVLVAMALLATHAVLAQQPGFKRTELQKKDLGTPRAEKVLSTYIVEKGKPLATMIAAK